MMILQLSFLAILATTGASSTESGPKRPVRRRLIDYKKVLEDNAAREAAQKKSKEIDPRSPVNNPRGRPTGSRKNADMKKQKEVPKLSDSSASETGTISVSAKARSEIEAREKQIDARETAQKKACKETAHRWAPGTPVKLIKETTLEREGGLDSVRMSVSEAFTVIGEPGAPDLGPQTLVEVMRVKTKEKFFLQKSLLQPLDRPIYSENGANMKFREDEKREFPDETLFNPENPMLDPIQLQQNRIDALTEENDKLKLKLSRRKRYNSYTLQTKQALREKYKNAREEISTFREKICALNMKTVVLTQQLEKLGWELCSTGVKDCRRRDLVEKLSQQKQELTSANQKLLGTIQNLQKLCKHQEELGLSSIPEVYQIKLDAVFAYAH